MNEGIEGPDGVKRGRCDVAQSGAVGADIGDVLGIAEQLAAKLERGVGDVDEDQALSELVEGCRPAPGPGADLEDSATGGNNGHEDVIDQGLLPLRGGSPLLASPAPLPVRPHLAIPRHRVLRPAAMRRAEDTAAPLDGEHLVIELVRKPGSELAGHGHEGICGSELPAQRAKARGARSRAAGMVGRCLGGRRGRRIGYDGDGPGGAPGHQRTAGRCGSAAPS